MKAQRSPEHVFLFPESSVNTDPPLGRAGASSGTPPPPSTATIPHHPAKYIRAGAMC